MYFRGLLNPHVYARARLDELSHSSCPGLAEGLLFECAIISDFLCQMMYISINSGYEKPTSNNIYLT